MWHFIREATQTLAVVIAITVFVAFAFGKAAGAGDHGVGYVEPDKQTAGMPRYTLDKISFTAADHMTSMECAFILLDRGEDRLKVLGCAPEGY
mgnify:CR=1 FL=1